MQISKIVRGNDFKLQINVVQPQYLNGGTEFEEYNVSQCTDVHVNLYCAKDQTIIPLEWEIKEGTENVIIAKVLGKWLHVGVYSLEITGTDPDGRAWRYKNKSMFSIVDATAQSEMVGDLMKDPLLINAETGLFIPNVGPQGPQGERGADGNISFEELTPEQLESLRGPQGVQGDKGETGPQGDKGVQGDKGDKGDTGETGPQGPQGDKGEKGDKGDKGDAFTYEDFTPEQLESLRGPQGEIGPQGPQGEPGPAAEGGEPGFIKFTNPSDSSKVGLVSSLSEFYDTNIGKGAVIEGGGDSSRQIIASGNLSHAEGYHSQASGYGAHAEGGFTVASSGYSHAEGNNTVASGWYSHAEGTGTKATKNGSHAEGASTKATSDYSHAEGYHTTASGDFSHAEGDGTVASGYSSHAEGYESQASGEFSHAGGANTVAGNYSETAIGKLNKNLGSDSTNFIGTGDYTLFTIGNGTDDNSSIKHNALDIRQNGDIYYVDTEKIDGTNVHYYDAPVRKLQDAMVTSTTAGLKIEVVTALPENPNTNTLYIVQ